MDPRAQAAAVDRWLVNEMLSRAAGDARNVRVLLVWQPIPTYKYDLRYHVMRGTLTVPDPGTEFYTRMNARRAEGRLPNLLWLADIQEGRAGPLYVDELHYTGAFAATIANHIGEHLRALGWVCRSIPGDRK